MSRLIFIGFILMVVGCAFGQPDLPPGSGFPRNADVDPRLHLTGADRAQIARLVAVETSQPIRMVWRAGNPDKVLVTCGSVDLARPTAWAHGTGYILQRTGAKWTITDRPQVGITPRT